MKCPKCDSEQAMMKTAYMDEGWILQWECSFLGCDFIEQIPWAYGDREVSVKELKESGYVIV